MGVALACTFMLLCSVYSVQADDVTILEKKASDTQSELSGINQEMVAISEEISSIELQNASMSGEILRTQDALNAAQSSEDKQYADMKSRIKYLYENGNTSLLELLFAAESLADFLNKADFIENVSDYDRQMLEELSTVRKDIEAKQNTLAVQQKSLGELQKKLTAQQAELQKKAEVTATNLDTYKQQLQQLRAATAANSSGICDGRVTQVSAMKISDSEVNVLAAILECEAYQEYNSLLAVATVILNRVNDPRFADTISGVVYAQGQFEPVSTGRLDKVLAKGPTAMSKQVAKDAVNGARLASVADCYYFLYAGSTTIPGVNVGDNLFFRSWQN